jgi:hypothetical protein
MHRGTALILGDLGERQPRVISEVGLGDSGGSGEVAADGPGEAVPELPRVRVPEDVSNVVIAGHAQRLSYERSTVLVDDRAAEGDAVCTCVVGTARTARLPVGRAVNPTERGSREGDEKPRPVPYIGRDRLAPEQPRLDEVERIARVEP